MEENEKPKELSSRHKLFVDVYLETWNITRAAQAAEYKHPRTYGSHLLTQIDIQAEIKRRLAEKAMEADEVLARLKEQASANIGDFILKEPCRDEDGNEYYTIRLNWDMIKEKGHLIKKITHNPNGPVIELYDGQSALVHIGKHHGLFIDRTRHEGVDGKDLIPKVSDEERIRAISTIANALRDSVSGAD